MVFHRVSRRRLHGFDWLDIVFAKLFFCISDTVSASRGCGQVLPHDIEVLH